MAAQNPEMVKRLAAILKEQHAASEAFPFKALDAPAE